MAELKAAPPPAYQTIAARPPSYSGPSYDSSPEITSKHDLMGAADYSAALTTTDAAVRTTLSSSEPLASSSTSLQPFSKLAYPKESHIPESSWKAFFNDLRSAVAPTGGEKALAIVAGTGVAIGTHWAPLGVMVGGLVWKRCVEKNVAQDLGLGVQLAAPKSKRRTTINQVIDHYNALWQPLGVRVRIESIDQVAQPPATECQCAKTIEYRQNCCGESVPYVNGRRADGCCARYCRICRKSHRHRGGKLRQKVRRHIVEVILERLD